MKSILFDSTIKSTQGLLIQREWASFLRNCIHMQGNAKIIFETILKGYLCCEKNDPLYLQEEEIYLLKRYKDFQFSIIKE